MARERTADDQVIALLARSKVPLERSQIAQALQWAKSMTAKVLRRLITQDLVEISTDSDGTSGRPSEKFTLKPQRALPIGVPFERRYERDDVVITPTDREARVVLHRRDGFVELEYLDGPRALARTCIHASNLKPFQAGRARPDPVRKT